MNILIVSHFDPAGIGIKQKKCIEKHTSHRCRMVTLEPHPFGYDRDIRMEELEDFDELFSVIEQADVIQFIITDWEDTVPFGPVVWSNSVIGKKVCVMQPGEPFILNPVPQARRYIGRHVKVMGTWDRVADDLPIGLCTPLPTPIPGLMDDPSYADIFATPRRENDAVVVSHFPSADIRNGTFLFESVMHDIIRKYPKVESKVIRHQNHRDAIRSMWESDIIFDEVWIEGIWGQASMEAISMGKVALAYISDSTILWWQQACGCRSIPVVNVSPETLEAEIERLVLDRDLREEVGRAGREWFSEFWDSPSSVGRLIAFFETLPVFC